MAMKMKFYKKAAVLLLAVLVMFAAMPAGHLTAEAASSIKTKAEAVAWLKAQDGAWYDLDNDWGPQCSDFVSAYINFLLYGKADIKTREGGFGKVLNAPEYANASLYPSDWKILENTPTFVPEPGDIFVSKSGCHVGVVISSDVQKALIVDQNSRPGYGENGTSAWVKNINWAARGTGKAYAADYFIRPAFSSNSVSYTSITPGTYYLKNKSTGKALCLSYGKDVNKQNIDMYTFEKGNKAEQFAITKTSDGYKMRPLSSSSRLVNAWGNNPGHGSNVNLYNDVSDPTQWWKFEKVSGGYILHNAYVPSCVLASDGWNAVIQTKNGGKNQIWELVAVEHTCDKKEYMFYWSAHPHYNCYRCSVCGEIKEDRSSSNSIASCKTCNPPAQQVQGNTEESGPSSKAPDAAASKPASKPKDDKPASSSADKPANGSGNPENSESSSKSSQNGNKAAGGSADKGESKPGNTSNAAEGAANEAVSGTIREMLKSVEKMDQLIRLLIKLCSSVVNFLS